MTPALNEACPGGVSSGALIKANGPDMPWQTRLEIGLILGTDRLIYQGTVGVVLFLLHFASVRRPCFWVCWFMDRGCWGILAVSS